MKLFPRLVRLMATSAVVIGGTLGAVAQNNASYPSSPVTMIVPFAPGGTADLVARLIADQLSNRLDQPFVVENRTGAGGRIGTELLSNADPDGYTVGFGSVSTHATSPSLIEDLSYDPQEDFAPIALIGSIPSAMIVHSSSPAETVDEFIEMAKENPGEFNFGSAGVGSNQHLGGELFKSLTETDMVHVAYQNQGMVLTDLSNGAIQVTFNTLFNYLGQIEAGDFRPLAVAAEERWPSLPDIPTMAEVGLEEMEISTWLGLFGSDGIPQEVVTSLNTEINAILNDPAFQERLTTSGVLTLSGSPEDLAQWREDQAELWREVIETAGVEVQ